MTKIDEYKEKYNCQRSEDIFGIIAPPDYQCPNLDKVINSIEEIERLSYYNRYENEDELKDRLNDINYKTYGLVNELENIRKAIADIREWGQQWKNLAKKLIEQSDIDIEEI